MKILGIDSVVYGVTDLAGGIRFFQDWGLKETAPGSFETASGQHIVLKDAASAGLPAAIEPGSSVREVVWAADNAASLKEIAAELARDREVRSDPDGTIHSVDDSSFAIAFRVAAPRPTASTAPSRLNHPLDLPRRVAPKRIGHVVYNVPAATVEKASAFYLDRLQFRLSDRAFDLGDFMRASGSIDHHNIFFLKLGEKRGFNHVAFEVDNFDEVVVGGKFMEKQGWTPHTRPGRHWLGSNLFWYFKNPSGGNVEYYSDMDQMDDRWEPRIWEKGKYPGFAMWVLD
jgi:catechol 2,3-dioxygenase-like lactoylglutathione lyase family enzyme